MSGRRLRERERETEIETERQRRDREETERQSSWLGEMSLRLVSVLLVGQLGLVSAVPHRPLRSLQSSSVDNGDCAAARTIRPDGRGVAGSVDTGGQNVCYTLSARQGSTYTITADLNGLSDSILSVLDSTGAVLAENDDADDGSVSRSSAPALRDREAEVTRRTCAGCACVV